jgi:hypothetical protein
MKGFVISFLVAAIAFLLAVFLWKTNSPPAAERVQHSQPLNLNGTTAGRERADPVDVLVEHSAMPAQLEMPVDPVTFIDSTDQFTFSDIVTDDSPPSLPVEASKAEETGAQTVIGSQVSPAEQLTLEQTSKSDTSLRNADFPRTYISAIHVDLTSPNHWVELTWTGPNAASQKTGPFHSSPGRGLGNNDCDDVDESNRDGSNCTPKGKMRIEGFSENMRTCAVCRYVTWIQAARGIAFHYYPDVPNYPASHGCVRLEDVYAAQLIHNNSKIGATEVTIDGKWEFVR